MQGDEESLQPVRASATQAVGGQGTVWWDPSLWVPKVVPNALPRGHVSTSQPCRVDTPGQNPFQT